MALSKINFPTRKHGNFIQSEAPKKKIEIVLKIKKTSHNKCSCSTPARGRPRLQRDCVSHFSNIPLAVSMLHTSGQTQVEVNSFVRLADIHLSTIHLHHFIFGRHKIMNRNI